MNSVSDNTVSGNSPSISDNEIDIPTLPPLPPENTENTSILRQFYEAVSGWYNDYKVTKEITNNYVTQQREEEIQRITEEKESVSANKVIESEYREKVIETLTDLKETLEISVSENSTIRNTLSGNTVSSNNVVNAELTEHLKTYMEKNLETSTRISENVEKTLSANYVMIVGIGLLIGIIVAGIFMRWFK